MLYKAKAAISSDSSNESEQSKFKTFQKVLSSRCHFQNIRDSWEEVKTSRVWRKLIPKPSWITLRGSTSVDKVTADGKEIARQLEVEAEND